ncbi:DUF3656 domain-containing U32 family peptidase [Shigella sonnei]
MKCQQICTNSPASPTKPKSHHNWQQALTKTSSERRVAVDIELGGWQDQLILTLTSEEGVSITHTLDGQFDQANNAEKAMNSEGWSGKTGQTIYYARNVQINLPGALFGPTVCETSSAVKPPICLTLRVLSVTSAAAVNRLLILAALRKRI